MKKQKKQTWIKNTKKRISKILNVLCQYYKARKKLNTKTKEQMRKLIFISLVVITTAVVCASCNATRTITTTQTHIKGQDTVVTMTTQTKETYDATIKPKNVF